jgi:hypothetical protein
MISSRLADNRVSENRPYLVLTDIIITLIHAFPVRTMRERFCYPRGSYRPAGVTRGNSVRIN